MKNIKVESIFSTSHNMPPNSMTSKITLSAKKICRSSDSSKREKSTKDYITSLTPEMEVNQILCRTERKLWSPSESFRVL